MVSRLEGAAVPPAAVRGTPRADRLAGSRQADRIDGRAGDDVVLGRGGHDVLIGRKGDDLLRGGRGDDRLVGGKGQDLLKGGREDDLLLGGGGADALTGGGGDDVLDGGAGPDRLTGGGGRDTFRFSAVDQNIDRITDYEVAVDRLDLGRLLPEFAAGDRLADFVHLTVAGDDTIVAVSPDGNGDFVDLARLLDVQIRTLSPADLGLPTGPAGDPLLVSTNADGEVADGLAFLPSLSGDGRFVTFASTADNLVPGADDGFNLFRKDLTTGKIVLVAEGRDKSAVSADGETVVHRSFGGGDIAATDLVSGDARVLGSVDEPSLSADGSRAAFEDDSDGSRVARVVDTATGATIASIQDVGEANPVRATLGTGRPDLSPDGDWLAFAREGQILLRPIADGDDLLVTAGGNGFSTHPGVSSDGRFVTFQSGATNLVAGDADAFIDVYRAEIDPASGAVVGIELVSATASGATGNGDSLTPAISDDGRFIAFRSAASNLAPGDENGIPDIFVKDMASGLVQRLELDGDSSGVIPQRLFQAAPDISGDGAFVAYTSDLGLAGEDLAVGQVYVAPVAFEQAAALTPADLFSGAGPGGGAASAAAWLPAGSTPDLATLLHDPVIG